MFCALSLVVRPVWLESFGQISVAPNECAADIDALNSTRPVIEIDKNGQSVRMGCHLCVCAIASGGHKFGSK